MGSKACQKDTLGTDKIKESLSTLIKKTDMKSMAKPLLSIITVFNLRILPLLMPIVTPAPTLWGVSSGVGLLEVLGRSSHQIEEGEGEWADGGSSNSQGEANF